MSKVFTHTEHTKVQVSTYVVIYVAMVRILRGAAPGALLAALLLLPFLWKAFTIDDTLFLKQAQHLLVDPWHPTAFDTVWTEKPSPLRMRSEERRVGKGC